MRNTLSYAVLRIDACENIDVDLEDRLAVTSIFATEQAAEQDAARLNALAEARGIGSRYVTFTSRLKK